MFPKTGRRGGWRFWLVGFKSQIKPDLFKATITRQADTQSSSNKNLWWWWGRVAGAVWGWGMSKKVLSISKLVPKYAISDQNTDGAEQN